MPANADGETTAACVHMLPGLPRSRRRLMRRLMKLSVQQSNVSQSYCTIDELHSIRKLRKCIAKT